MTTSKATNGWTPGRIESALKAAEAYADKHRNGDMTNYEGGLMLSLVSIIASGHPQPQVKLEVEHSDVDWHQWVFLGGYRDHPTTVKRDAAGRRRRNAWREWLVLSCNNGECHARALVRMDDITGLVQKALPVPVAVAG